MSSVREGRTPPISRKSDQPRRRRSLQQIKRVRERARQRRALDLTWRAGVLMVGVAILIAGLAGLVLPALPGWVLIFVGLGVLGTEFAWARRLLDIARRRMRQAAELALDPRKRRRNQIIAALGFAVFAVVAVLYVNAYGFGLPD